LTKSTSIIAKLCVLSSIITNSSFVLKYISLVENSFSKAVYSQLRTFKYSLNSVSKPLPYYKHTKKTKESKSIKKDWIIPEINISLNLHQETINGELTTTISRNITFLKEVSTEQKDRSLIIAAKYLISKILKGKITINTTL
jgi:hypothetical protein